MLIEESSYLANGMEEEKEKEKDVEVEQENVAKKEKENKKGGRSGKR